MAKQKSGTSLPGQLFQCGSVKFEAEIHSGTAVEQIVNIAEDKKADLIITSTHGLTGFKHVLIGSTAEHVVRRANCPVMVVPARFASRRLIFPIMVLIRSVQPKLIG